MVTKIEVENFTGLVTDIVYENNRHLNKKRKEKSRVKPKLIEYQNSIHKNN